VPTPASVLADLFASDPTRPRLTFYDDAEGPTRGERIELSAKVIANWVAKAANALQDEFDAGPGSTVALALPLAHWRAVYWALATWSVGATLSTDPGAPHDVLVTDDDQAETDADLVVVTLPALARAHPGPLPAGAMDEARELSTYGDQFSPYAVAPPEQVAWAAGREAISRTGGDGPGAAGAVAGEHTAYDAIVRERDWPAGARVNLDGSSPRVLLDVLSVWALDGSVVLVRSPDPALMADRLAAEGVTLDLSRHAHRPS
jgi:uncharacterized protein (TIGR03089 family)